MVICSKGNKLHTVMLKSFQHQLHRKNFVVQLNIYINISKSDHYSFISTDWTSRVCVHALQPISKTLLFHNFLNLIRTLILSMTTSFQQNQIILSSMLGLLIYNSIYRIFDRINFQKLYFVPIYSTDREQT